MPEPILIVAVTTCALSAIGTGIRIIRNIIKRRKEKREKDLEMERKLLPIKVFDKTLHMLWGNYRNFSNIRRSRI